MASWQSAGTCCFILKGCYGDVDKIQADPTIGRGVEFGHVSDGARNVRNVLWVFSDWIPFFWQKAASCNKYLKKIVKLSFGAVWTDIVQTYDNRV
jgi:hypothetical protein